MKYILNIITLLLFLTNNSGFCYQYKSEFKVEHIALEQGITNNLIFSIYQDSKGFIWFGTMFGLVRYDGISFKTFRHNPADTNSISNDDVVSIFEDKDGYLWIGTYFGGLNKLDRRTGEFKRYIYTPGEQNCISSNTVWKIIQDKEGILWFATEGGGLCKYENGTFSAYKNDSANQTSIGSNSVYSLAEDDDGNIWAGTAMGGLNRLDKKSGVFTRYKRNKDDSAAISGNFIRSLYKDSNGDIWAGTLNRGLNKYEKKSGRFFQYFNNSNDRDTATITKNSIFSIIEDRNNTDRLFISTGSGFYSFTKSGGEFSRIWIYDSIAVKQESIISSIMDNSGVIWVSTYYDGLHKIYKNNEKFLSYLPGELNGKNLSNPKVNCFYEDEKGNFWIGTANGLNKLDSSGQFTYYFSNSEQVSLTSNNINCITGDNNGTMWIGTNKGLNRININTFNIEKYYANPNDFNSLISDYITKLLITKDGTIWVGTSSGLNKYDKENNTFTRYQNNPNDSSSLSENTILSLYEDINNNIWVGTYLGLSKLDNISGKFIRYKKIINDTNSLSNNYVFSFCEDRQNNLWIGTGGGLNKFNPSTGRFTSFLEKDGLANTVICGIEADDRGNLWLSTKKGLSKFAAMENTITNYTKEDGLQSSMFNEGASYKLKTGEILFGSMMGFNISNPQNLNESGYIPPLIFTTFTKFKDNEKSETDISGISEITLDYDDNIFTIEFASLDYTNPAKNKYSYMLKGFEDTWNYTGNSPKAVFTNLDPGTYTFMIRGTNSDGVWNNQGASLVIKIKPPFWKTWWFYTLAAIVIISSAITAHRFRLNMKMKNLIEIENAKEKERETIREQASRDYHDELGHKLTRIAIHTKRIKKKLGISANGITNDLTGIVETSQSLQGGAKDLIWSLNPQEDTLYDFAVRLKDFGNELFDDTGINFQMSGIDDSFKEIKLSMQNKRHLIFIFKEAMNNSLKYSDCKNIALKMILDKNILEIILEDDGIGFNLSDDLKGYGIKNIYNRAKKVNGSVEIESALSKGTKITFNVNV